MKKTGLVWQKRLETWRLILEELTPAQADLIFALRADPQVVEHTGITPYEKKEQAEDYIAGITKRMAEGSAMVWAARLKSTGQWVGTLCLFNFNEDGLAAEVGYDLLPAYWGLGLAGEGLAAVVDFAFSPEGVAMVFALVVPTHKRSIRVLEKAGLVYVGLWEKEGKTQPMSRYELTWEKYFTQKPKGTISQVLMP